VTTIAALQAHPKLIHSVNSDELKLYQADSLREERLGQKDFAVCRECGNKHALLHHHIKRHKLTPQEYLEKWNYPPVVSPSFQEKGHQRMKELAQQGGKYFGGKRYGLKPGEGTTAKQGKPPTPAMRRHALRLSLLLSGKTRPDRRGKKSLGGAMVQTGPADDARIAELRLAGKSNQEIATEVGLTSSSIFERLRYLGFPPGKACRFLHGEPITKTHFAELLNDFGATMRLAVQRVGDSPEYELRRTGGAYFGGRINHRPGKVPRSYYYSLSNYLSRHEPGDVLSLRFADLVLDLRKRWTDSYCFYLESHSRKRVRYFLLSEIGDGKSANYLFELGKLLREPLNGLRKWLRDQNVRVQPNEILNWICGQSRLETAHLNKNGGGGQGFRALMFLWLSLKQLIAEKPDSLAGQRSIDEVVNDLLSKSYGATPARISVAASGSLTAVNPRTLAQAIREQGRTNASTPAQIPTKKSQGGGPPQNVAYSFKPPSCTSSWTHGAELRRN
jgi:hypothetical protein